MFLNNVRYMATKIALALSPTGEAQGGIVERKMEMDPWVISGIGIFIAFMLGGVLYAAVNGWFGPWIQGLLSKISGQFS